MLSSPRRGTVVEALPNELFRVKLEDGSSIMAHLSSRLRMKLVRLLLGDRVEIEVSSFDPHRGRITSIR